MQQVQRQLEQQTAAAEAAAKASERSRVEAELLQRQVHTLEADRQEHRAAAQEAREQVGAAGRLQFMPGCRLPCNTSITVQKSHGKPVSERKQWSLLLSGLSSGASLCAGWHTQTAQLRLGH